MSAAPTGLVILGGGIAGCALAARLRGLGWRGPMTLVEAGQGAGGRASSRRSRRHPTWTLDHGAPFLTLDPVAPPALLAPLLAAGRIRPWPMTTGSHPPVASLRELHEDGTLADAPGPLVAAGALYRGWPAMADLAEGMLELAEAARGPGGPAAGAPAVQRLHGRRAESLERREGLWVLRDRAGEPLARGNWLVLAGTLLAHPRCLDLLGCREVPLAAANRTVGDAGLARALQAVADLRYDPRLALLLRLEPHRGQVWRDRPFRHLWFSEGARRRWGLERLTLQPREDGRCGLVAHARPQDLIDGGWLESRAGGSDAQDDDTSAIAALSAALVDSLGRWMSADALPLPEERQLMRWGGAFPLEPGLDREAMVCPDSQVALCGDAIAGRGFARAEGAWHSGEWLAQRLLPCLSGAAG